MPVNTVSAVDVPLEIFGGLNTELGPTDIPAGLSPDNQDVAYLPGSVFSREGLSKQLASPIGDVSSRYLKTYTQPDGTVLTLVLDSAGNLWQENVTVSPGTLTLIANVAADSKAMSVTALGKEWLAFSDGLHGVDVPRVYDGENFDRVSQDGPGAGITAVADSAAAGNIVAGDHQLCFAFLTRQGYITKPSPIQTWTAGGAKKVDLTGIPLGPSNTVARIVFFTAAAGSRFFWIPFTTTIPVAVTATVIPDNTTVNATLDFSDDSLLAATAIDIAGNNLFNLVVLGPCLGVFSYGNRLLWWGESNKVQNLLNMGFDGGYYAATPTVPLGWTAAAGGELTASVTDALLAWKVTGDGTANPRGLVTQPAYADALGVSVLLPNTRYRFRCWGQADPAATTGNVVCDFYSATSGILATATIIIAQFPSDGGFIDVEFDADTPASIPADAVLRVWGENLGNGQIVYIDEMELVYADRPWRNEWIRASYINNPESFDGISGQLASIDDDTAVQFLFVNRNGLYIVSEDGLQQTSDQKAVEPSGWSILQVASECGGISAFGHSSGEDWEAWATRSGIRIFEGGHPYKISQEIQGRWEEINWAAQQNIWLVNDPVTRRLYVGIPINGATWPNAIYPVDYREMDTAGQIASRSGFFDAGGGRLFASELARKWTKWNLACDCAALIERADGNTEFALGSGNGLNYGNFYILDSAKLTDDDYGAMAPYYFPYFFVTPEQEQAFRLKSHRKLFQMVAAKLTGTGKMQITPYTNSLTAANRVSRAYPLSETADFDSEWPVNVLTERCTFKFQVVPDTDQDPAATAVRFTLSSMVATLKTDPWSPVRGLV